MTSLSQKLKRMRPLLGAYVTIEAESQASTESLHQVISEAFEAISKIDELMSFHKPDSELSKLNRCAFDCNVPVSLELYQVIFFAKELYELTKGAFDITVADKLLDCSLRPRHYFMRNAYEGRSCDIQLNLDRTVCFLKPLCIDLGGIAKGFAVDVAIEVLKTKGIENGMVNAGGDMRCFGHKQPVYVRHPRIPGEFLDLLVLENEALATSSDHYKERCDHIHGTTRQPIQKPFNVSVRADSCMIADALTKAVLILEDQSQELLARLQAVAYLVYPDNRIQCYGERV